MVIYSHKRIFWKHKPWTVVWVNPFPCPFHLYLSIHDFICHCLPTSDSLPVIAFVSENPPTVVWFRSAWKPNLHRSQNSSVPVKTQCVTPACHRWSLDRVATVSVCLSHISWCWYACLCVWVLEKEFVFLFSFNTAHTDKNNSWEFVLPWWAVMLLAWAGPCY